MSNSYMPVLNMMRVETRRIHLYTTSYRTYGTCPQEWGHYKLPVINQKIRVDHKTGEYFELGKLAPETYRRVMEETKL